MQETPPILASLLAKRYRYGNDNDKHLNLETKKMKLIFSFLKQRLCAIILFFTAAVFFTVSFLLYHIPSNVIAYPLCITLLLAIIISTVDFLYFKKRRDFLNKKRLQDKECLLDFPPSTNEIENQYIQIINNLKDLLEQQNHKNSKSYKDMVDYYTAWAHQIKTPIASMNLTLQNQDDDTSRRLRNDLFRIQQYVEMVMAFLRTESPDSDLVIKEYSLDDLIRQCIRKFKNEFIMRKLSLNYNEVEEKIITDQKWFCFMIEQLLSNALKYTKTGSITITAGSSSLTITDTGIGIDPQDLPRIFQKGYTGINGRLNGESSGIGLYLCNKISKNLGMELSIQSEPQKGTSVTVHYGQKKFLFD